MTDTQTQNDPAIEELMKDAITSYMLDRFDVVDRLKVAVQQVALELLAEEMAMLRKKAATAKARYPVATDVSVAA